MLKQINTIINVAGKRRKMDTEFIKEMAMDINNGIIAATKPLYDRIKEQERQIAKLQAFIENIKKQYSKDVCSTKEGRFSKMICDNRPPEITSLYNACLSCVMRKTCEILFVKHDDADLCGRIAHGNPDYV